MNSATIPEPVCNKPDLSLFKELLLRTCGHSFENEREHALSAALGRRMATRTIDDHGAYLSLLRRDSDELHQLIELLTVNETYFLREPNHLKLMVSKLLPKYMVAGNQRPVRILSAGCSTGEEPYSIAIMLREQFGADSERLFAISAVDIDSAAISVARQGIYGSSSFRGMDKVILERYFVPAASGKFQVKDCLRKNVEFDVVNLLGTSYPQKMQMPDVILYRNVSIYFPGHIQREIFGRLAELLNEDGCLLVGASETIHHDVGILSLVKQDSLFYYHKTPKLVFEERRSTNRVYKAPEQIKTGSKPSATCHAPKTETRRPVRSPQSSAPQDIRASFDEAVALSHNKQFDKALSMLEVIIRQDSSFEKAYCLKGSLLLNATRFDEARTVCEAILDRDSLCLEAYLMLGMIARQNSDDDAAFKRFREAIYLDSSCWLAHFYSAEILFARNEVKRARSGYEAAQKILGSGLLKEHGLSFFPLTFNAEQFIVICRHKLSLLKEI